MNTICLLGRITRDLELKYTQTRKAVVSFSIAVDRGIAPKDGGERQTDFINIVAWEKNAEFVTKYFVKGQLIAVEGRLQIRDYTDKEGNKRKAAEVVASHFSFTGDRRNEDGAQRERRGYDAQGAGGYTPQPDAGFSDFEVDDDELPF